MSCFLQRHRRQRVDEVMCMNCVLLFSRSPSFPLIQDTVLKGKLSVPELRVTRLMNRSISCTMKNPKGELFSYPPNSQVSASLDKPAPKHLSDLESVYILICALFSLFNVSHLHVNLHLLVTMLRNLQCYDKEFKIIHNSTKC